VVRIKLINIVYCTGAHDKDIELSCGMTGKLSLV
jgi:hypothetical protein